MTADLIHNTVLAKRTSECRDVLFVTAVMVAAALYVQFYLDSMFSVADDGWLFRLGLHTDYYPFSARVFTTYPVLWLGRLFGDRYELAFALFQYTLYAALGPLFYKYLRQLEIEHRWALAGMTIMYLSYATLAAFHEPVSTWDDFLQYGAQIAAFSLLLAGRPWAGSFAFAFGVAAREATILIYPVWVAAVWLRDDRPLRYRLGLLLPPLVAGFIVWYFPEKEPAALRIHGIMENFRDIEWTRNSLYSLFMGLGFLWLLTPAALLSRRVTGALQGRRRYIWLGSLYAPPVVSLVVLFAAFARETRLFFPPFVFVIPLALVFLYSHRDDYRSYFSAKHKIRTGLTLVVALAAGLALAHWLFPHFDYRNAPRFARNIFAAHVAAALLAAAPIVAGRLRDRLKA